MKFDESYELLADVYAELPKKSADKLSNHLKQVIAALEQGQRDPDKVQRIFDKLCENAKRFADETGTDTRFLRDCLAADVMYILDWFDLTLDVEDAMRGMRSRRELV